MESISRISSLLESGMSLDYAVGISPKGLSADMLNSSRAHPRCGTSGTKLSQPYKNLARGADKEAAG